MNTTAAVCEPAGEHLSVSAQGQTLSCLGYGCSNLTAAINNGRANPFASDPDPNDREANVALTCMAVGNWPFLFVVAVKDISAGLGSDHFAS